MTNKHLTIDELVDRLYGVGADDHLDQCAECSQRFEQLRERKEMSAEALPVSYDFLAAQRRNIYARMGEKPQSRMGWLPALAAAACLLTAVVFTHRPVNQPVTRTIAHSAAKSAVVMDPQLFSDVYSMEQSMEPLAAQPIHALFEDQQ